ncbi:MAG: hypothetical protein IJ184_03390 [Alphaproteobacteria bacterium]|nr:hypothetical protein [Alphaproteobacteria bacterium]
MEKRKINISLDEMKKLRQNQVSLEDSLNFLKKKGLSNEEMVKGWNEAYETKCLGIQRNQFPGENLSPREAFRFLFKSVDAHTMKAKYPEFLDFIQNQE